MSTTETNSYDADEWGQYRSLSTLAVIALVLGLCSIVAFASPLMLVVPLAAVAASLLALRGISASEGGLSGATLARLGLALAILFSVASFARVKVRDVILQRQAERVARQWLALAAQGRSEAMRDLMSRDAVEKFSAPAETGQPAPSFFDGILASALMRQDPLVLGLSELGKSGDVRFLVDESQVYATGVPPQALLRFVAKNDSGERQTVPVILKRFNASTGDVVWLVDSWELE